MTKEKNDMTNEHNFKVGDRVRLKGNDAFVGTIVDIGLYSADILWDCDPDEIYLQAFDCIEHIDRRTAFLTRLRSLLREFDASLVCLYHNFAQDHYPCVVFKEGEILWWSHYLNTMDFDKE